MSRKWSRMVEKNTKVVNRQRAKQGKQSISSSPAETFQIYKGRSWLIPILLLMVGIFCFITFRGLYEQDAMYWVTGSCYIGLGIFIFLVRRPFLKIGKNSMSTRRFSGDRLLEASDISLITFMRDAVIIESKTSKMRWTFSRFYNLMDMTALTEAVRKFASAHSIQTKEMGN